MRLHGNEGGTARSRCGGLWESHQGGRGRQLWAGAGWAARCPPPGITAAALAGPWAARVVLHAKMTLGGH